jgi:hypothetical protein
MHKHLLFAAVAVIATSFLAARTTPAAPADRFLHVQVSETSHNGENVNVNLPLGVAEKVLPTIDKGPLHNGRVTVPNNAFQGIDIPTILDAVRTSPDNQIVSVKQGTENIDVSKSHGNILVHVKDSKSRGQNVDVSVPLSVVNALFNGTQKDELDVAAALQELDKVGNDFLVTVEDANEHVRVWIDSQSQPQ